MEREREGEGDALRQMGVVDGCDRGHSSGQRCTCESAALIYAALLRHTYQITTLNEAAFICHGLMELFKYHV